MKITSFEYKDHSIDWILESIDFSPLTLVVGASGVGKTKILEAIFCLKRIARGSSLNGAEWRINFLIGKEYYKWVGIFENKGISPGFTFKDLDSDDEDDKEQPNIENEKLYINNELVIDRTREGIVFNGIKTVKLSQQESVISLLKEEEQIKNIYTEFSKILFDNNTREIRDLFLFLDKKKILRRYAHAGLNDIRNSNETLRTKLFLLYTNLQQEFNEIKSLFIDVFPYVDDIKIEPLETSDEKIPSFVRDAPFIQIKETGIENWIDETKLSSGMYRTLMHIAELYLCADGTVVLIDEFENSLGINCIDDIASSIATYKRDLQFIITSHHPYIINNISLDNWKVITRKAGVVKNYTASQLNLGASKHQAFTQLINLDKYAEGVEM